ncbi:hypothetical protein [Pseudovibrio sp. SPO723]|uniref:hypothetical protein n=1 Tax=Nesiotobacter zosterae TaxID=392721 RepID=UPI0029C46134|nr:hypothetical protein [Pseudovibrio sp. SPO723]MDX5592539.1 hypothetical protein [Pseudovibrio sp. SPO723]
MNVVAKIGHNQPPVTPFDESKNEIESLFEEGQAWIDGEPIQDQKTADFVAMLLDRARKAAKKADDRRKAEVKPLDDEKKAIQAKWNELIGDTKSVKGRAVMLQSACKEALAPWLEEQDRLKREEEEKARRAAEEERRLAEEALQKAKGASLQEKVEAEQQLDAAKHAEAIAAKAAKDKAGAKHGSMRSVGLRTKREAKITDMQAVAAWYWKNNRSVLEAFLSEQVQRDIRNQSIQIDGVEIIETKVAV